MDDLMKCLYEFMITKRLGALWDDQEYAEVSHAAEMQMERVEENLNKEQRRELRRLLENVSAQNSIENEHRFRAALALFKELNALVRA